METTEEDRWSRKASPRRTSSSRATPARREARRPARQARRPLLLSQGRHARLHDAGLRDPRRLRRVHHAGAVVLGVSPDKEGSHVKFKEKYGLPFTLLADPEHEVAEEYGVGEKNFGGKTYMGVERSTFVIDGEGNVAKVMRRREARHARRPGARGAAGLGLRTNYNPVPRGCGGIGRRARFRSVWGNPVEVQSLIRIARPSASGA